jgi:hypothetical protein
MNTTPPGEPNARWLGFAKFLFIVFFVVILFLLGQSMVHHRFFEGGRFHRNGSVGQ